MRGGDGADNFVFSHFDDESGQSFSIASLFTDYDPAQDQDPPVLLLQLAHDRVDVALLGRDTQGDEGVLGR